MLRAVVFLTFIISFSLFGSENKFNYAEVKIGSTGDMRFLQQNNIDIDRTSFGNGGIPLDGKVTVYVTQEQYDLIESRGMSAKWTPLEISKAGYRSNISIGDSMLIWQNRYPEICRRLQIGTSVQGRPLWVLKISDNVDTEEHEPEVKYVSTIHGDEVTGMEMCLFMIENILKGYQAENDTMKFLVNNTEMYFMPLMNPDGNANVSRYNANGYDLNRNFPEGTYYDADSVSGTMLPEIAAVISWTKEHNFVMSTNFHGGALVANYLYDIDFGVPNYSYAACPDDPHVTWLAYNYSVRNTPMFNGSFTSGITNGSQWYQITGGMQDWNYRYHNCLDITLEISNTKWPNYSYIPGFWADNRESMFWYLMSAHRGIYGIVTDSVTDEPLEAEIKITGINKIYFTDPDRGDYYRILKPGTYSMTVSATGYISQTINNIVVTDNTGVFKEAAEVNVQLVKDSVMIDGDIIPEGIVLEQNYPNPFNPVTKISFTLDHDEDIRLAVLDVSGAEIAVVAGGLYRKGSHTAEFRGADLTSGVYYYSLSTKSGKMLVNKMLMLK